MLGTTATALAFSMVRDAARRQSAQTVDQAVERLSLRLRSSLSGLRGVSALAVDGSVDPTEFEAFGTSVRRNSVFDALAYSDIVPAGERGRWEQRTGLAVRDTNGQGGFSTAAVRERYAPIRLVVPQNDTTRRVLGFDITSDPARGDGVRQALASAEPVLVGPIRLATNGGAGLYVVHAVRDRSGTPIGLVSSGLLPSTLVDDLVNVPGIRPTKVTLTIDGAMVVDGHEQGTRRAFDAGGRRVELLARSHRASPSALLPFVVLGGTVALAAAAVSVGARDRRERVAERLDAERQGRLALLTDELARAHDARAVVATAAERGGAVVGADHTNVGLVDVTDAEKLIVVHDKGMDAALGERFAVQAVSAHLPLTDCVRTAQALTVPNREAYAEAYPDVLQEVAQAGIHSVVCVPLRGTASGAAIGVVGFAWNRPLRASEIGPLVRAAAQVGDALSRSLERALDREAVELGMQRLREFTADLAGATALAEVERAVGEQLATLFGVPAVTIESTSPDAPAGSGRRYEVYADATVHVALVVHPQSATQWTAAHEDLMVTVVGLVQSAWRRAREHEQEKSVLLRLQATLLTAPPSLPNLEVDVRYVAALDSVGLGGDWYSIIERDDAVFLVVGDIAGHGPEAVALMAEVKTVVRHVLERGATIGQAMVEADASLRRRDGYASAVIVELRTDEATMRYVNAGHPPLLLRSAGGVQVLADSHRPWLGVPASVKEASVCPFVPGDVLLLYTDGLVERRGRPIEDGVDRVRRIVADTAPGRLFDALIADRAARTDGGYVDDDVALLSAVRLGTQ